MPVWGWFFIAALVVIAVAGLIVAASAGRRKTDRPPESSSSVPSTSEPLPRPANRRQRKKNWSPASASETSSTFVR